MSKPLSDLWWVIISAEIAFAVVVCFFLFSCTGTKKESVQVFSPIDGDFAKFRKIREDYRLSGDNITCNHSIWYHREHGSKTFTKPEVIERQTW